MSCHEDSFAEAIWRDEVEHTFTKSLQFAGSFFQLEKPEEKNTLLMDVLHKHMPFIVIESVKQNN